MIGNVIIRQPNLLRRKRVVGSSNLKSNDILIMCCDIFHWVYGTEYDLTKKVFWENSKDVFTYGVPCPYHPDNDITVSTEMCLGYIVEKTHCVIVGCMVWGLSMKIISEIPNNKNSIWENKNGMGC